MNVFNEFYENGRITDIEDSKKVYRILAKKIHPDVIGIEKANTNFIKLKQDYDLFVEVLKNDKNTSNGAETYTRQEMIELLIELQATGFLLNDSKIKKTKQYKARIVRFNKMLKFFQVENVYNVFSIEKSLCELRSEDRNIYDDVKLIFYNVVSFHYEPRTFIKKSTILLNEKIQKYKIKEEYKELYFFLLWLIKDMELGSVFSKSIKKGI